MRRRQPEPEPGEVPDSIRFYTSRTWDADSVTDFYEARREWFDEHPGAELLTTETADFPDEPFDPESL